LRKLHGPGGGFLEKSPLAAGGKKSNLTAASHDAAPSPGDERKPTQTVCAAYRSPMPWGFMVGWKGFFARHLTIFLDNHNI